MTGRRWQVRGRRSEVAGRRLEVGDGRSEVAGLPNAIITTKPTIIAIIAYTLEIEQFRCKLLQMGPPWAARSAPAGSQPLPLYNVNDTPTTYPTPY